MYQYLSHAAHGRDDQPEYHPKAGVNLCDSGGHFLTHPGHHRPRGLGSVAIEKITKRNSQLWSGSRYGKAARKSGLLDE